MVASADPQQQHQLREFVLGAPYDEDDKATSTYWSQWSAVHEMSETLPRLLHLGMLESYMMEALSMPSALRWLVASFERATALLARKTHEPPLQKVLESVIKLLIRYAVLMTTHPYMFPCVETGPMQMAEWLCSLPMENAVGDESVRGRGPAFSMDSTDMALSSSSSSSVALSKVPQEAARTFLRAWYDAMSPEERKQAAAPLFRHLADIMRQQTLLVSDHLRGLRGLWNLVSAGSIHEEMVFLPSFMPSWLYGVRFERETIMGAFLCLGPMQADAGVAEALFSNVATMSEQQRQLTVVNLRHKIECWQELLQRIWHRLLMGEVSRPALLSWIAGTLMGNWERTKMRSQGRTTSTDEFLLNLCSVMLSISAQLLPPSLPESASRLDLGFFARRPRLVLADETRLHASGVQVRKRLRRTREPIPTPAEQVVLRASFGNIHCGIICDKCRSRNVHGLRFKCVQCRDFDVCEACEQLLYQESLNLRTQSGVLFQCPFSKCSSAQQSRTEVELRRHVAEEHALANGDGDAVLCPVCAANGAQTRHRRLNEHLQSDHADSHDPRCHVLLKIEQMVSSNHWRLFQPLPVPKMAVSLDHETINSSSTLSQTASSDELEQKVSDDDEFQARADAVQNSVVHVGVSCANCKVSPIRGIRYSCFNCEDYDLCSDCDRICRSSDLHVASHLFLKIRYPLEVLCPEEDDLDDDGDSPSLEPVEASDSMELDNSASREDREDRRKQDVSVVSRRKRRRAQPILYPSAVVGSYGFPLEVEWHFMTCHALHLGLMQSCARFVDIAQNAEAERRSPYRASLMQLQHMTGVQLLSPRLLSSALAAYSLIARATIALIDPDGTGLPLREQCPDEFAFMPEYILEDMATFLLFLARHSRGTFEHGLPDSADLQCLRSPLNGQSSASSSKPFSHSKFPKSSSNTEQDIETTEQRRLAGNHPSTQDTLAKHSSLWIVHLFVYSLGSPTYIKNPYLRGKLAEALAAVAPFATGHGKGCQRMGMLLCQDVFLVDHLLPSLLQLYVSVERTGAATQFYDKFNVRNVLSMLLNFLLEHPVHRQTLTKLYESKPTLILQVAHYLISDTIYVLDEALVKSESLIRLIDSAHSPMPTQRGSIQRAEARRNISQTKRNLRIVCALSAEALRLVDAFAGHPHTSMMLLRPEMIERVAHTVNYYITHLMSGNAGELQRVELLECGFDTMTWIHRFCLIYVHLGSSPDFVNAVVHDCRNFKHVNFPAVLEILQKHEFPSENLTAIAAFFTKVDEVGSEFLVELDELESIPDEFMDPILHTLMEDPVVLPASGVSIDRSVICRHLLSDCSDPFNRSPLTVEMLAPNDELRSRIEEFKKQAAKARALAATETQSSGSQEKSSQ